ncbi:MAG: ATP-grasp domain-containing protein [Prevotella sp.]|nr:ATP-grasp domain-containing protein [Prevotella sp.]
MKKLLILGAGQMQVPIIALAKEKGLNTIVADYDPDAPGFEFADVKAIVSTVDKKNVLQLAKDEQVNGILTTSDYPVRVVAYVGEQLGLPSMTQRVAEVCTNKYVQRQLFKENGINTPFFVQCDAGSDLSALTAFPYIVKPVDSSASRGVVEVHDTEELKKAVVEACALSRTGNAIVESFIYGKEFSVETLTQDGETHIIQITEKLTRGEEQGFFVEDTHIEPARISVEEADAIRKEVLRAAKAVGVDNCPTHTEIKLWDGKPYIIEMACRLGGDYITSDLVPLSTGISMLENLIRLSLGEQIDTKQKFVKWSCVQFLNEENYWRCKEFVDAGDAHICRFKMGEYKDAVIKNSLDRLGYIIIQADAKEELEQIITKIK